MPVNRLIGIYLGLAHLQTLKRLFVFHEMVVVEVLQLNLSGVFPVSVVKDVVSAVIYCYFILIFELYW